MDLVTILSPHADDSGSSLAITIRALVSAGQRVRIVNCFTVSKGAAFAAAAAAGSRQVQRIGGRDGLGLASAIGPTVDLIDFQLLEAQLRLGCPADMVRRLSIGVREDTEARRVAGLLTHHVDRILLAPLGLGGHIDHLVAREAGIRMAGAGYRVGFYEDLPYAAELRECCVRRAARLVAGETGKPLAAWLIRESGGSAKPRSVMEYAVRRGGRERVWMPERLACGFPVPAERVAKAAPSALRCVAHTAADHAKAAVRWITRPALREGSHTPNRVS